MSGTDKEPKGMTEAERFDRDIPSASDVIAEWASAA